MNKNRNVKIHAVTATVENTTAAKATERNDDFVVIFCLLSHAKLLQQQQFYLFGRLLYDAYMCHVKTGTDDRVERNDK
ncbi:unnamed protein product [Brugia timori]|uniref:Uncharacterized protein n=1 Tax=Brugia timori TaxID=42155 RepID=A0A0R3QQZ2_9BILA|nr:unnamed protein product [Brugia timori]